MLHQDIHESVGNNTGHDHGDQQTGLADWIAREIYFDQRKGQAAEQYREISSYACMECFLRKTHKDPLATVVNRRLTKKMFISSNEKPQKLKSFDVSQKFSRSLGGAVEQGFQDDDPRVNAWGGAIALGHPLGASGAKLVTTALNRLIDTNGRYALCTICRGVGQGIALIIERI